MPLERRGAEPAAGRRRDERGAGGLVQAARDPLRRAATARLRSVSSRRVRELLAPVHDRRVRRRVEVDHDARAAAVQVQHAVRRCRAAGGGRSAVDHLVVEEHGVSSNTEETRPHKTCRTWRISRARTACSCHDGTNEPVESMLSDSERALARAVLIHGPISRSELTSRLGLSPPSLTRLAKPFLDRGSDGRARRPVRRLGRPPRPAARRRARTSPTSPASRSRGRRLHVVATDVRAGSSPTRSTRCSAATRRASPPRSPAPSAGSASTASRASGCRSAAPSGTAAWSSRRSSTGRTCPSPRSSRPSSGSPCRSRTTSSRSPRPSAGSGSGRGIPGFVVITIGAGIGYALVVNGQVVHSREAGVGLGGHIPLRRHGPRLPRGPPRVRGGDADVGVDRGPGVGGAAAPGRLRRGARGSRRRATPRRRPSSTRPRRARALRRAGRQPHPAARGRARRRGHRAVLRRGGAGAGGDRRGPRPARRARPLYVDDSGFSAWARGAATVAIQDAVDRIRLELT